MGFWRCDLICVLCGKAILGSAVLFGMTKDLDLSVVDTHSHPPTTVTTRLSWATSIFYFGMLAGLYPMTFTLQRFQVGRVLGVLVVLWGMIAMLTATVTSWRGLFAQRFFLGFVESVIPTAFMCIVSGYYTQQEQALRQSWWFSSTGGWTIIGGALNYGFAQITGGTLAKWQYIYLLAGSLTVLFACVCFAVPNSGVSAWYVFFGYDPFRLALRLSLKTFLELIDLLYSRDLSCSSNFYLEQAILTPNCGLGSSRRQSA